MKRSSRGFHQLSWTLAAAFAAVWLASGFEGPTDKFGVVDISKLVTSSDFGKASQAQIDKISAARKEMLTFVTENSVMTVDQAQKFKELSVKSPRTPDEDAKYSQIKADVAANSKKLDELQKKPAPTTEEKALMTDFDTSSRRTRQMAQGWAQEFQGEVQQFGESQYNLTMDRVQAALVDTAKAQAFTLVFDTRYARYGANDLTDAALAAMNAKK